MMTDDSMTAVSHLEVMLVPAELLQHEPARLPAEAAVPLLPGRQQQVVVARLLSEPGQPFSQKSPHHNTTRVLLEVFVSIDVGEDPGEPLTGCQLVLAHNQRPHVVRVKVVQDS